MARSTRKPPRNPPPDPALPGQGATKHGLAAAADPLAVWFKGAARDLPWRRRRSGYHALVSELMLQQTQVSRVLEKFGPFVRRFPTAAALAAAPEHEVLAAWQGLGYYRRARLLHAAAKAVVERHDGKVPTDLDALLALPGVGRYTAGAIASIVHGARAPIVDGNVTRVFQRLAARDGSASDRPVTEWAWREAEVFVAAAADPAASNEALMELGATVCTPAQPRCADCPVARLCAANRTGKVGTIPAPKKKAARKDLVLVTVRVVRGDGALLLEQRPDRGLWAGLWQPPTAESADGESLSESTAAELVGVTAAVSPVGIVPFATTHRSIRFVVFEAKVRGKGAAFATKGRRWVSARELPEYALSNAAKRVLEL